MGLQIQPIRWSHEPANWQTARWPCGCGSLLDSMARHGEGVKSPPTPTSSGGYSSEPSAATHPLGRACVSQTYTRCLSHQGSCRSAGRCWCSSMTGCLLAPFRPGYERLRWPGGSGRCQASKTCRIRRTVSTACDNEPRRAAPFSCDHFVHARARRHCQRRPPCRPECAVALHVLSPPGKARNPAGVGDRRGLRRACSRPIGAQWTVRSSGGLLRRTLRGGTCSADTPRL
jgi:hypothetical protein